MGNHQLQIATITKIEHEKRDRDAIRTVINSRMREIRNIYESKLDANPLLEGIVQVRITINPMGKVTHCGIQRSSLQSRDVEGIVLAVVGSMSFPPAEHETTTTYPFAFRPAE